MDSSSAYFPSFSIEQKQESLAHFLEFGFVVIRDVFSSSECESTRESMTSFLESNNPGLEFRNPHTWDNLKGTGKYGLSCRGPCFESQLVQNRQNENLISVFENILQIPKQDVIVSHDRFTVYRATKIEEYGLNDGCKYATDRQNIHMDLNPWWCLESSKDVTFGLETLQYSDPQDFIRENNLVIESMGTHIQCVLNFQDNLVEDGGTLIVPKFHTRYKDWAIKNARLRKPLPWLQFDQKGIYMNVMNVMSEGLRCGIDDIKIQLLLQMYCYKCIVTHFISPPFIYFTIYLIYRFNSDKGGSGAT